MMTGIPPQHSDPHANEAGNASGDLKRLRSRRLTLLASVAGLAALSLIVGSGVYQKATDGFGPTAAQAADTAQASLPHPTGFADIAAKVKPAVISVRVTIRDTADETVQQGGQDGNDQVIPFAPGSPLQKFFRQFGDQDGQPGLGTPQPHERMIGEGSGFFISPDGFAVTNNHVVKDATSVEVTTADGAKYSAKVVGTDPKTDIAVIKVNGGSNLPYVKFASHEPRVGDWVVAVGNPFGLGGTVTAGIVSAESRDIGAGPYDDYIQIDAPINRGNSGGPAFDMNGNVIGINTAIYSPSGGSVGIGFDIPAQTAQRIVDQLRAHGSVTRGWLGVQIQPVTAGIADSLGLKKAEGAIVDNVENGSPAAKAGLKSGDLIAHVNGTPVKDARQFARTIATLAPDSAVKLDVLRNGQNETVSVTLAQMPNQQLANASGSNNESTASSAPRLGLTVAPAHDVDGAGNQGVVVTGVDPNGPAAAAGVQTGNVILDVGGKPVANGADVVKQLQEAKAHGRRDVLIRVKAGDATQFVAVPLGKA
jgi:serine protease Do